jgi:hypothetical protein
MNFPLLMGDSPPKTTKKNHPRMVFLISPLSSPQARRWPPASVGPGASKWWCLTDKWIKREDFAIHTIHTIHTLESWIFWSVIHQQSQGFIVVNKCCF